MYKIEQDHDNCIGCGACVGACPENWELGDDGKSSPKKITISEDEFAKNKEAAEVCPANVIHIKDSEGKQII